MKWRLLGHVGLALACAASAVAGAYLTVRAFATTVEPFTLGTVSVRGAPVWEGRVDVYVPIVDWGVRASPYEAPVAVELRFRSLDREAALAALRSGEAAEERLAAIRSELAEVGRRALYRAALLGIAGGVGGGLLGGAVVGAALHRRRWLGFGAGLGLVVPLAFVGIVFGTLRHIDYTAFERPTFYAQGRELPRLLSFSGQLLTAGESYSEAYEQTLAGLANLVAFASGGGAPETSRSVVVASDLHGNTLVLPVLEEYTQGKTVFLAGDFTLLGTTPESRLVPLISRLGTEIVAVSGNHDSRPFMLDLVDAGVTVLTRDGRLLPDGSTDGQPVIQVDGFAVAGYDDPLEGTNARFESRPLELTEARFAAATQEFVAWFEGLPQRPDVVLVHQHGLAHALLDAIGDEERSPLIILTGHDHEQHLHLGEEGVLVDGGTVGAGGPFAIGVQTVGFAEVHFSEAGKPLAVDLIEVEPLSGNARASRSTLNGALE
jgi:predicted MPP superfamily phosphohydrolase